MTVYKYFIKSALKNKWIIISYTIIFFIIAIIQGSTNTQIENSFMETKLNIGVINNSNSELSRGLVDYLEKRNNIISTRPDEKYIKEQIFLEIANGVIVIPEDFETRVINSEKSIEVYRDDRKIESYQIENQINKFISFSKATYDNGRFDLSKVAIALDQGIEVNILETNVNINQKANTWFKFYFNFMSYIILAIYISVIGFVMVDFTDKEIENRRKVSSIKLLKFNKEIYLGQLTVAGFITLAFILGSIILKGKYIGEIDYTKYLFNTMVFSFSILCLVFLLNNITNSRFIINGLSTVLSLGTSFVSGVMVPQEFLGERVLRIAKFFPTYYFVRINERDISSFLDIKYEIFMQLLFAMVFLIMGLYFSKAKQRV